MSKGSRNPPGASTVYRDKDGYWHGRVSVGVKDDGRPDRRHVGAKTKAEVVRKVRELERLRDSGKVPTAGRKWTVGEWLEHWLWSVAKPSLRESSFDAYRYAVRKHLIPAVGRHRLDRLQPEHLERLYRSMIELGARPATAHQVHRTVRTALGEALRRGHVVRNVAALAKPPRVQQEPVEPLSLEEVQALLKQASQGRNGARWAVALALGLRQGEVLGLRWSDVDFDTGSLRVRGTLVRPVYAHGCGGTCGRKAGFCPQRRRANPVRGATKSAAGQRVIGLPDQLLAVLKEHRQQQDAERELAGNLWAGEDWVFAAPDGQSVSPNSDYRAWKALLNAAGVRQVRLHDARHTAATVLLVLGVPERTVMSIMGWSSTAMAARYQHVTDPIRRDVARRVGELLWSPQADGSEPEGRP